MSALDETAATRRTRVVVRLDTARGCQLARASVDALPRTGWSVLERVDLVRPFNDKGIGVARLITERGRSARVFLTRAAWDDMDPLYKGTEPEEQDDA